MSDHDSTGFVVVSSPEQTVLAETERLIDQLRKYNFSIDGILFNKLLEGTYDIERVRAFQAETMRVFAEAHIDMPIIRVPYLDVKTLDRGVLHQLGQGMLAHAN